MTTVIAWITLREGHPAELFLASDSRLTWETGDRRWDGGQKLFACKRSADIFAYCGESLFPTQILGQIVDLVDHGLLFHLPKRCDRRHEAIAAAIQSSYALHRNTPDTQFEILHLAKYDAHSGATFKGWCLRYDGQQHGWTDREVTLNADCPTTLGSGAARLSQAIAGKVPFQDGTRSKVIFSTFCDHLAEGKDPLSGGAPQLVGLRKTGAGIIFGIILNQQRYLHGIPATAIHQGRMEWRDSNFVSTDGATLQPMKMVRRRDRARTRTMLRE